MAQREPEVAESTSVTIYGRVYDLRGGEDRAYLQTLASIVDSKMREAAAAGDWPEPADPVSHAWRYGRAV